TALVLWVSWADEDVSSAAVTVMPRESDVTDETSTSAEEAPKARSELVLSAGEVLVDGVPVESGQSPLSQGQHVVTGKGRACLTVDPNVDVCLGDDSEVAVGSLARNDIALEVVRGKAVNQLTKL